VSVQEEEVMEVESLKPFKKELFLRSIEKKAEKEGIENE
jgi:hypothetical protein